MSASEHGNLDPFVQEVKRQADRAEQARRPDFWAGLGLIGTVGWMVSVPAVLGALAGRWIDAHSATGISWTISLLTLGIGIGCTGAWRHVRRELDR